MSALLKQHLGRSYRTVSHGEGVYLCDTDGRRYIDACGGAMTASLGHGVEEIAAAVATQLSKVASTYRTQFNSVPAEELARRLADLASGDLDRMSFVNSGSEATEFAIRAAVGYWRAVGAPAKVKILGRELSYHGMTTGALSMSGHAARRPDYGSLLHHVPGRTTGVRLSPRMPEESEEQYAARAAAALEAAVVAEDPTTVAAVILEPIVGAAGGVLVPPAGCLRLVGEPCDRLGVLLIADEVITGMGRTRAWFATGAEQVVPDLMPTGKGLSAGYSPVAAVLLRDHLVEAIARTSGVAPFGHTFSGNLLGAATCLAVLDYMERKDVLANVRERGAQLEAGLDRLAARFDHMADVRGRGLLSGFELLVDRKFREAPDPVHNAAGALVDECFERGLIIYPGGIAPLNNAAILCPPLTITEAEVDHLLTLLAYGIEAVGARNWTIEPRDRAALRHD